MNENDKILERLSFWVILGHSGVFWGTPKLPKTFTYTYRMQLK